MRNCSTCMKFDISGWLRSCPTLLLMRYVYHIISYHYRDNVHSNHPCLFRWYIRCSDFIYLWKVSLFFLILCYKIQSVCVFVCLFGCLSVSMSIHNRLLNRWWGFYRWLNGSRVRSATKSYFSKTYLRYFLGKISPDV